LARASDSPARQTSPALLRSSREGETLRARWDIDVTILLHGGQRSTAVARDNVLTCRKTLMPIDVFSFPLAAATRIQGDMEMHVSYPFALLCLVGVLGFADSAAGAATRGLFHIARSKNQNIVYYDVRLDRGGHLQRSAPLDAYWLMHAEDGRREELSWLERKLAYGYEVEGVSEQGFTLWLTAALVRKITVRFQQGRYRASTFIRGHRVILKRIYVRTDEGVVPKVLSVDLHGSDPVTGDAVSEGLTPQ
jgi:hypothetical protein